jgi:transposase
MAHVRRKIFDEHAETGSPLAAETLKRIGMLFDIERPLTGQPAEERRRVRQAKARPVLDELAVFLDTTLARIPGKSDLAKAIRYARSRWTARTRYVDDGRLEISNCIFSLISASCVHRNRPAVFMETGQPFS